MRCSAPAAVRTPQNQIAKALAGETLRGNNRMQTSAGVRQPASLGAIEPR